MCGIAGFVKRGPSEAVDREILKRMVQSLAHRGPDDEGYLIDGGAHLGHRRLSIIDVEGGRQPIANEDGQIWVVLNGEIYNYRTLREELLSRGHLFKTRSDTEVLVHLYEDEGPQMLSKLKGMFAFALWDARKKTLLLARDRMGKKPLYYGIFNGEAVFASELRALLKHPSVPKEVDPDALYRFLTLDYVPTPFSILRGVRKVRPGGYCLVCDGKVSEGLYYDIPVPERPNLLSEREALAQFWKVLVSATGRRLESEVPLGVFLSGGLDSTLVLLAMAEHMPASEISTFTIGFDEPSFDESPFAEAVARHLGTKHHVERLSSSDCLAIFEEYGSIADEPLGDYSLIPTTLLCRFARNAITVALSGDGGDELFYGYPTFAAHGLAQRLGLFFRSHYLHRLACRLFDLIPPSDRDWSLEYRLKRFWRGLPYKPLERHFAWIGGMEPPLARRILAKDLQKALSVAEDYPDVLERAEKLSNIKDLRLLAYLYARLYLLDGVLVKVDRASMSVGLEVRSPFLDEEMVSFAFSLPPGLSLRRGNTKFLLRRALENRIPKVITRRPKKGFGVPLAKWLREDLRGYMLSLLSQKRLEKEGYFNPLEVQKVVEAHLSGRANMRKELFNLMAFEAWLSFHLL